MPKKAVIYLTSSLALFLVLLILVIFQFSGRKASPEPFPAEALPSPKPPSFEELPSPSPRSIQTEVKGYEEIEKIQARNPWIERVAIVKQNYIVRYDYEFSKIEIVVYTNSNKLEYSQGELDLIQQEVERELITRGVPVSEHTIKVRIYQTPDE